MTAIDIDRAKVQTDLRYAGALEGTEPAPPKPPLSALLNEIFFTIIRGAVAGATGNHAAASRFLKAAHKDLALAIARADQIAASERLPP